MSATPSTHLPGWLQSRRRLSLLLGLAAFLLYANTFSNGYVLDDVTAIRSNSIVTQGFAGIPEIFTTPYLRGAIPVANDLYRPLPLATFAIEWQLFENNPAPAHVVNVLLFACCVMLLFLFLDTLFERRRRMLALLAALLFAAHPIHTEVVANIKSRDELLCFALAFGALYAWLIYARNRRLPVLLAASGLYFLSLLSKETSFSFVLLVPVLFFVWERSPRRRSLIITGSAWAIAASALLIRYAVLAAHDAHHPFDVSVTENALAAARSLNERLATAFVTLGMYLKLLVLPHPLRSDYSYNTIPLTGFTDWRALLSLAAYVALAVWGIIRLTRHKRDIYALGILLFLIPLALFSNTVFLVGATMAERFLFFPSAGFCLAAGYLLSRLAKGAGSPAGNTRLYLILGPVLLIWAFLTVRRNGEWKDEYTLYTTDFGRTPASYRLPYYLASVTLNASHEEREGSPEKAALLREAISYLKQSIAVYPHFGTTHAQAGISYIGLGNIDSAAYHAQKAISLNPRDTFSRNNLAAIFFKQGRYQESIAQCRENLKLYPQYARAYTNIGACYLRLGAPDSAAVVLRKALSLEPDNQAAAYYLSVAGSMTAGQTGGQQPQPQ